MSKIRVNTNALDQQAQQMEQIAKMLGSVSSEVSAVNRNLSWKIASRSQIRYSLNNYSNYINNLERKNRSLSSVLKEASRQYQNTEKKLGAVTVKGQESSKDSSTSTTKPEKDEDDKILWKEIWTKFWDVINEGGIIGPLIAILGGLKTGGMPNTTKDWLGILKKIAKSAGKIGKATTDTFDWKKLFGFEVDKLNSPKGGLLQEIGNEIDKLKWSNAEKAGDKISVVAKWSGYALTLITTGYDNFTDKSNATFGRKLAETIGETGVKIAEGMVLGTAIGIACAGAPAIVIGGLTVGAAWGIDALTKTVTKIVTGEEKDFAETVSDFILDNTSAVLKKAGDAIGGWWKDITSPSGRYAYGGGGSW